MVSMLDSRPSGQVQALAADIALCSWAKCSTLTLPLSTQMHIWVLVNLMLASHTGGSRNRDKL